MATLALAAGQRSFDDLGTPLHEVTFCVVDLETTGATPDTCGITEVGAVKLRGGECLGTFQTLVNPGGRIPPAITVLTGITEAMVLPAPRIDDVLPSLLEFMGGSVLVGHNLRFDVAFLDAALARSGRPPIAATRIDTVALARRLVREEVPDCRLGTLAARFRLDHRPSHRALDDALATGDLLHVLLERAAAYGVLGLDDLVALPSMGGHPQAAKLRLTSALPRRPGVYVFRGRPDTDGAGRPLYVGKAADLRARVRSYFSTDDRRKIGSMLREAQQIDHVVCSSGLEAAVLEARLIGRLRPHYNRQGTGWDRAAYVRLTREPYPRLTVGRSAGRGAPVVLGPLPSTRTARAVADAIESATALRRCTAPARPGLELRVGACAAAQLGVAACPCTGDVPVTAYAAVVDHVVRGLGAAPSLLLDPLTERMHSLAAVERYEEAADARDRAGALAAAIRRQRRLEMWRRSGRVVLALPGGGHAELDGGRLVRAWSDGELALATGGVGPPDDDLSRPATAAVAAEILVAASWLDANARRVRVLEAEHGVASPLPRLASFAPRS